MIPTCIMAHPVGTACNIACGYCFHRKARIKDLSKRMSVDVFLDFYKRWITVIPENKPCNILWHGGEPTLRGKSFFEEVFEAVKILTQHNKLVSHALQTNGVLIDFPMEMEGSGNEVRWCGS